MVSKDYFTENEFNQQEEITTTNDDFSIEHDLRTIEEEDDDV